MALAFYMEVFNYLMVAFLTPGPWAIFNWPGLVHPLSRLPVFLMAVCAGLLCIRIKNGDKSAINSKEYRIDQKIH